MKLLTLLLTISTLSLSSCNLFNSKPEKINSGEIEYEITYPHAKLSKVMSMILPKKMTLIFKGDKILAKIKKGKMFTTEILSCESSKLLEMRYTFDNNKFKTVLNDKNVQDLIASQPVYHFGKPTPSDSLFGCSTIAYDVDCKGDTLPHFSSVFSPDFNVVNAVWFSSYKDIEGMPMIYLIDRFGIIMHVSVTKITKRDVDDSEFEPKLKYKEISYKKYDKKIQDLFDSLLN